MAHFLSRVEGQAAMAASRLVARCSSGRLMPYMSATARAAVTVSPSCSETRTREAA